MSRNFVRTSSQNLINASAVVTSSPLTMACWFKTSNSSNTMSLMQINDSATSDDYHILYSNPSADRLRMRSRATSNAEASASAGFSLGVWNHACGVVYSSASRAVFLNGGSKGTDTNDQEPVNLNETTIGSGALGFYDGLLAEAAIWNVALSDAEVLALARGVSPLRIRPGNLEFYCPIYGVGSPEPDYIGGFHMTLTNAPTQDVHAPVAPPFFVVGWDGAFTTAGGGPTTYFLEVSGAVTPTGALIKQINTAYTGQVGPTGDPDMGVQTTLSGSVTPTGALAAARTAVLSLAGAVTATGSLIIQVGKLLSGSVTPTGAITKQVQTAYTGQAGPTGDPDLGVQTSLAGSVTSSGTLAVIRAVLISLAGSVTPDGILVKQVNTAYTGQVGPTGEPDQSVQTSLAGSVTPTATLVAIKIILLTVTGSVTPTGSLVSQVGKFLGGAVAGAGSLIKQVQTAYSGQVGPGGDPDLGIQTSLAGSVTPTGSLSNVPIIGGAVTIIQVLFKGMYKGMFKKAR